MRWRDNHYRPTLEFLEHRDLPTSAMLSGGFLYVLGTTRADHITVSESGGQIAVAGTTITVGRSHVSHVSASQVHAIAIYGYGGGDVINLRPTAATAVTKYAYIYSGAGTNTIYGGNGGNYIVGGGHDHLNGGAGTDFLVAAGPGDVFNGGGGLDFFYRPIHAGAPFVDGARVRDVKQGESPSCQADAVLAEAAKQGYNFEANIRYLGSSVYDVSLFGGRVHEHVTFSGWYTSDDPYPNTPGEFWTILEYRARLQYFGINPGVNYTIAQWDTFNRNTGGRLYSIADAMAAFTGRGATFQSMYTAAPQTLQAELSRGDFLVASTPPGSSITADGIAKDHAYALMSVYYQYGTWKVRLYNPWAMDSAGGRTLDSLSGTPARDDGFITLTWAQFKNPTNFQGITRAAASAAYTAYFKTLSGNRE
jgi:hypothetical protein